MAPAEHDGGWEMYSPSPIGGKTPPELSTGNADDDEILRQIAARTSLDLPRSWQHFLLVPDEAAVGMVARPLAATGWEVSIAPPKARKRPWCVIAERDGVVLTPQLVCRIRELFEEVASRLPGAVYDGWQASIDFDEVLDGTARESDASAPMIASYVRSGWPKSPGKPPVCRKIVRWPGRISPRSAAAMRPASARLV
jgi:hypothetical protein